MAQPAMYWGSQPPQLVKTAATASEDAGPGDIVDVAVGAGSFETLVAAVKAAGLVETLKGEGPFTVFAPTDEAFAAIPQADLEALLADKAALTAVLTYHVVPGKVMAADVVNLDTATTVQGGTITIDTSDTASRSTARTSCRPTLRRATASSTSSTRSSCPSNQTPNFAAPRRLACLPQGRVSRCGAAVIHVGKSDRTPSPRQSP